jgi:hypothetical protein
MDRYELLFLRAGRVGIRVACGCRAAPATEQVILCEDHEKEFQAYFEWRKQLLLLAAQAEKRLDLEGHRYA